MLSDLAALTPPLIVGLACLIALVMFLRRQMGPAAPREEERDDGGGAPSVGANGAQPAATRPAAPGRPAGSHSPPERRPPDA